MVKRLSVGIFGLAVVCMTAGLARAQSTSQEVKDKTTAAAHKTGEVLSDAEITTAVKTKLMADHLIGGFKIDVDTTKGVVTLTGPVETAAERAHALKVARHTHGVKRVVNKLTVEKPAATGTSGKKDEGTLKKGEEKTENAAKKAGEATENAAKKTGEAAEDAAKKTGRFLTDAEITSAVKTKMIADSNVHAMDINVDTDNGIVTLKGQVRSEAEKTAALHIARDTMGVKRVVDKLTVK